ncbi:hypothetical protein ACFX10_008770 [Malus domestica]
MEKQIQLQEERPDGCGGVGFGLYDRLTFSVELCVTVIKRRLQSEEALESTETMKWIAFAAIFDLICPLLGRGFLLLKHLGISVAGTSDTLLFILEAKENCNIFL